MNAAKGPGLRLQIVLSLAGVLLLSYVPLFFAIAGVTQATLLASREKAARSIGRAVAAHVAHAAESENAAGLDAVVAADVGDGGARAVAVFDPEGARVAGAGDAAELEKMASPARPFLESARAAHGVRGRVFDVVLPWKQAFTIGGGAMLVATLAGLLPALRAVKTRIPDAIAYE